MAIEMAQKIPADSWLMEDKHAWFRNAYAYASTQTHAISALSKCHPTELYYVVWCMLRQMGIDPESMSPLNQDGETKDGTQGR